MRILILEKIYMMFKALSVIVGSIRSFFRELFSVGDEKRVEKRSTKTTHSTKTAYKKNKIKPAARNEK